MEMILDFRAEYSRKLMTPEEAVSLSPNAEIWLSDLPQMGLRHLVPPLQNEPAAAKT